MALTPIVLPTGFSESVTRRTALNNNPITGLSIANIQDHSTRPSSSVTELSDNIKTIKDNSLLYQLISRLLLSPEQDKRLNDSLQLANADETSATNESTTSVQEVNSLRVQTSDDSFQFVLSIEITSINITQQSFTFTDETGSFTETRTIIQATSISIELTLGGQFRQVKEADPLVIDINGDGITTSGIEQGALFDIDADGILDQVSVTTNDNAFLALDLNNNGVIDNGAELFGDQTGYDNGFSYLKSFDENKDGLIDARDHIFNSLLVMRLINNEQFISELSKTDISSINLDYLNTDRTTSNGDRIVQISDYKNSDGQKGVVADLLLQYKSGIHS